jgi:hypothetical protein
MNERIEAYLKQHYCRDYFNRYGETVEDDYYFMYREEVDGLIELIVRECIGVIESMADPEEDSDRYLWAIQNASTKVRDHFGVDG